MTSFIFSLVPDVSPVYIGDSATLSYLHLFRLMVESIVGKSSFTDDPRRKNIVENVVELPAHIQPPSMLADRQTANVLVESFFTNVRLRPHAISIVL